MKATVNITFTEDVRVYYALCKRFCNITCTLIDGATRTTAFKAREIIEFFFYLLLHTKTENCWLRFWDRKSTKNVGMYVKTKQKLRY